MSPAANMMSWFWQAWLAAIVFIFPIPHTIALRNLLLLTGLSVVAASWKRTSHVGPVPELRPAAWGLLATTAWLLLQTFGVAQAPVLALDNLRGDWLIPFLTATLAAVAAARIGSYAACRAVLLALLVHMLWVLGWQLWLLLTTGTVGDGSKGIVPFGERDFQSSLADFLIAMTLAERAASLGSENSKPVFVARQAWAALAIALVAEAALRTRNGTLVTAVQLIVATILVVRIRPRLVSALLVAGILAASSLALDPRWSGLKDSLSIGWNSSSLYWLNGDAAQRPPTEAGSVLEESAYSRAAWAHEAVAAIEDRLLGRGFGRDSFGRAVAERHGVEGMVSSHSGWLDFALGAGLPGLALLLLTAGLAMRGGWRHFCRHGDAAGLMFSFLVGAYLLRCMLDGHLSGWRLGLFAFLSGVLIAAMRKSQSTP